MKFVQFSEARHVSTEALLRSCRPAGATLVLSQQRTSHAGYSLLEFVEGALRKVWSSGVQGREVWVGNSFNFVNLSEFSGKILLWKLSKLGLDHYLKLQFKL